MEGDHRLRHLRIIASTHLNVKIVLNTSFYHRNKFTRLDVQIDVTGALFRQRAQTIAETGNLAATFKGRAPHHQVRCVYGTDAEKEIFDNEGVLFNCKKCKS